MHVDEAIWDINYPILYNSGPCIEACFFAEIKAQGCVSDFNDKSNISRSYIVFVFANGLCCNYEIGFWLIRRNIFGRNINRGLPLHIF